MALKRMSFATNRESMLRTAAKLDRWARMLDIFYVKDFGEVIDHLNKLDIDITQVEKAWENKDVEQLILEQAQLLEDWEDDLREEMVRIPRCAVYFMGAMDRKLYGIDRRAFGGCDRHIASLSVYELIMSCMYRELNNSVLVAQDEVVERIMMLHRSWFQWQTDVQRLLIWVRRKEYENCIAWRPFLKYKIDRLSCGKCRTRYGRLVEKVRSEVHMVVGIGKRFNEKNYFGKLEDQPEYEEILYLRRHTRT